MGQGDHSETLLLLALFYQPLVQILFFLFWGTFIQLGGLLGLGLGLDNILSLHNDHGRVRNEKDTVVVEDYLTGFNQDEL